jgi:hypothetical protein
MEQNPAAIVKLPVAYRITQTVTVRANNNINARNWSGQHTLAHQGKEEKSKL